MANPEHLAILEKGVDVWNEWRKQNVTLVPNLSVAELPEIDLFEADLGRTNLRSADLHNTKLVAANLCDTDLHAAKLNDADLSWANLRGAGLSRVDLRGANLTGADLLGADLRGAKLFETVFSDTRMRQVQNLDTCEHSGPSTLDFRTLAKSGNLPLSFLRGCGLSETLIDYLPALLLQPIQFYSCFISFSTTDQRFAERVHADLQGKGVRCWFAPHHIQGGKKIQEQIDEAIRIYDRLLLILSDQSMKSEWVKSEIAKARQREIREKRQMLFPISLVPYDRIKEWKAFDADTGKDSGREIREYFIPDFSDWKNHDSYQRAFQRLLRDLKAEQRESA